MFPLKPSWGRRQKAGKTVERQEDGRETAPGTEKRETGNRRETAPGTEKRETGNRRETAPGTEKREARNRRETTPGTEKQEAGNRRAPAKGETGIRQQTVKAQEEKHLKAHPEKRQMADRWIWNRPGRQPWKMREWMKQLLHSKRRNWTGMEAYKYMI